MRRFGWKKSDSGSCSPVIFSISSVDTSDFFFTSALFGLSKTRVN